MNFCKQCDNLYYTKIDENNNNKLIMYCKQCGDENKESNNNIISSRTILQPFIINEYTKLDPTLPHINNIPCPNPNCKTNTDNYTRDIIFIKYNEVQMKYIYLCTTCDTSWEINK